VEAYRSEEEQIAAIKNWWKENGNSLIIGVVIALAVVFGWKAYKSSEIQKKSAASQLYQELLVAEMSSNSKAQPKGKQQADSIAYIADQLKKDFPDTEYANYASLFLAKDFVRKGDLQKAVDELESLVNRSKDTALNEIVTGRLARLYSALGQNDKALSLLQYPPEAVKRQYLEIKGDILTRMGKKDEAITAYKSAYDLVKSDKGQGGGLLVAKLANLGIDVGSN
jgi:predicted negative regulator of RcsB-dependent stress response